VFNALNPLGAVLSPRGLRSRRYGRWRLRQILTGRVCARTATDLQGIELAQARPRSIVRQVTTHAPLRFRYAVNRGGRIRSLTMLTVFSAWPYYVFVRD
jgi:hypothetical protein